MSASRSGARTRAGLAVAACLVLASGACAQREGASTPAPSAATGGPSLAALAGAPWTLVSLSGKPLPPGAQPPTAVFDGTRLSGFGGCNRYTGQVAEPTPGTLTVGPLAATKMACPSPGMEVEGLYFAALGGVTQYALAGGHLVLSGASAKLTFERAAP
jgi:heat shock protein HslJ